MLYLDGLDMDIVGTTTGEEGWPSFANSFHAPSFSTCDCREWTDGSCYAQFAAILASQMYL